MLLLLQQQIFTGVTEERSNRNTLFSVDAVLRGHDDRRLPDPVKTAVLSRCVYAAYGVAPQLLFALFSAIFDSLPTALFRRL